MTKNKKQKTKNKTKKQKTQHKNNKKKKKKTQKTQGCFVLHVCHLADGKFILICNWKMENEMTCVYMNHFTLGDNQSL